MAGSESPQSASSEDTMIVLVAEADRPKRRRLPKPRSGPTVTLSVSVPSELADELKDTVSVLPGQSLNALMAEALRRMLASHGLTSAPRGRRTGDDTLIVIAS